jgi:hypothetical protein
MVASFRPHVAFRPLLVSAALSLVSGCGDETTTIAAAVSLDVESCRTTDPGDISIGCSATAGVWLRGKLGGDIAHACVDISSLSDLPTVVAGLEFEVAPELRGGVEVAVYSPWSAEQGCPTPDSFDWRDRNPPLILVGSASFGGVPSPVPVKVSCPATPERMATESCLAACEQCLDADTVFTCNEERETCYDERCDDESCACVSDYESCLVRRLDGACGRLEEECLDECVGDGGTLEACTDECSDRHSDCLNGVCDERLEQCAQACPSARACATFPAPES